MELNGRAAEKERQDIPPGPPSPSPQERARNAKATKILDACKRKDVEALRVLATGQEGLICDDVRRQAWPLLLGCFRNDNGKDMQAHEHRSWRDLPRHGDEDQVQLDVDRSFIYYPNDQSTKEISKRKEELSDLILEVLRKQPYLNYFQGYHDICQVFLLVLKPQHRASAVARLSVLRIRDYMLPTLAPSLAQLRLIPSIIHVINPQLYHHLPLTQPFFAIPGILTMYAHDIQSYGEIARVFDVLLAREAVFSVYMFAQIVLQRADELFDIPADEPDVLHSILSKLPKPLDLEILITNTSKLMEQYPPEKVKTWASISSHSVLKTARWPDQITNQSLEDGEHYFQEQVKELHRAEQRQKLMTAMWKYRKPAQGVGIALAIGILAFWVQRSHQTSGVLGFIWRSLGGRYAGH